MSGLGLVIKYMGILHKNMGIFFFVPSPIFEARVPFKVGMSVKAIYVEIHNDV